MKNGRKAKTARSFLSWMFAILPALAVLSVSGCGKKETSETASDTGKPALELYCGAGIRPAAAELIEAFHKKTGIEIDATYAGSGRLLGQLAAARRGDLFMPGSEFYVDQALEKKLAVGETKTTVAYFVPVIFVAKGNPLQIKKLADLAEKKLRLGLGDERAVAVGRRSKQLFEKNKIPLDKIKANQVLMGSTVNELCVAVRIGNIDAAIVWDADAKQFGKHGDIVEIPPDENIASKVPIVRLAFSRGKKAADAFISFAASKEGGAIFAKHKYTVTPPKDGDHK